MARLSVVVLGWRYLTEKKVAKNRPPKDEYGTYWATLQDPEGNELCIGAT